MTNKRKILVLLLITIMVFSIGCSAEEETEEVEQSTKVPVETETVKQGAFTKSIILSGMTEAKDEVTIYPNVMGMEKILQLNIKEGDQVSAGQVIAVLDQPSTAERDDQKDLQTKKIQLQIESTEIAYDDALRTHQRNLSLYQSGAIPKINVEQSEVALQNIEQNLKALKVDLHHSKKVWPDDNDPNVTATISGTVTDLPVRQGGSASGQTPIAVITDLSDIEVKMNVNEMQVNNLSVGKSVRIYIPALGGKPLTGTVKNINPQMDEQAKAYPVTINIPNQGAKIKTGMHAEIEVITDSIGGAILVPAQAIITRENRSTVFLVRNDKAVEVRVEIGLSNGDVTIIKRGLKAGEKVITYGNEDVVDGDEVIIPDEKPDRGDK